MNLPDRAFRPGPSIADAAQLLAWLERHRSDVGEVLLRMPVLITLDPSRRRIARARIGGHPDALVITLDDLSLGVPLAARMSSECAGRDACLVLLRGVWRGELRFQVSRLERVIADADRALATHIEIAA